MTKALVESEADLSALIGQTESTRLEFKESRLLSDQSREKYIEELSKQISAFANTEGGQLILGIREEKKGKSRYAAQIDEGIDASNFAVESFQQAVEASVSPYLPGVRFLRIPLATLRPGRLALVIAVPRGLTAYQANDRKYYGRSEFEVRALPDHEIRLRILRQRAAIAQVDVRPIEQVKYNQPVYKFHTLIHNAGDLTLRTGILSLEFQRDRCFALCEGTTPQISNCQEMRFEFTSDKDEGLGPVYPGDTKVFPQVEWMVFLPHEASFADTRLECKWKVFLDDAPPSSGTTYVASLEFPVDSRNKV